MKLPVVKYSSALPSGSCVTVADAPSKRTKSVVSVTWLPASPKQLPEKFPAIAGLAEAVHAQSNNSSTVLSIFIALDKGYG